jgi:peptidoglycan/xylan/chitin deacetylase (PgdA/CDA1 family)
MIRFIKLIVSIGVCALDVLLLQIERFTTGIQKRCVVINYHDIKALNRNEFRWQMDAILRWATPISAGDEIPSGVAHRYVAITIDDAFNSVIDTALPELLERRIPFTVFVPTECVGKAPEWIKGHSYDSDRRRVMTEEELNLLKKSRMVTIGSHCATHRDLLTLTQVQAHAEIAESKQTLQRMIDDEVQLLSFPYGSFNVEHVKIARDAGYHRVFSILPTPISTKLVPFVVGRVRVDPEDWRIEFVLKISGAYRWLPYAFSLKSRIIGLLKRESPYRKSVLY